MSCDSPFRLRSRRSSRYLRSIGEKTAGKAALWSSRPGPGPPSARPGRYHQAAITITLPSSLVVIAGSLPSTELRRFSRRDWPLWWGFKASFFQSWRGGGGSLLGISNTCSLDSSDRTRLSKDCSETLIIYYLFFIYYTHWDLPIKVTYLLIIFIYLNVGGICSRALGAWRFDPRGDHKEFD